MAVFYMECKYISESIKSVILEAFRHIHTHPELSEQEFQTTAYIKNALQKMNIDLADVQPPTGVIAIIRGGKPGKTLALRADIDALPVCEDPSHEVRSCTPGVMHACGHDSHTACLLGAAAALKEIAPSLSGNILLLFQPAEETTTGAQAIMDTGIFEAMKPDAFFSLHMMPTIPFGQVGIRKGAIMAAQKAFTITVSGKGGHGASPHLTKDPIIPAVQIIEALQAISSRRLDPTEPFALSVCSVHGGNAFNIVPETVELKGTCRLLNNALSETVENWITDIAADTAKVHSCSAVTEFSRILPALDNDPALTEVAFSAAGQIYAPGDMVCQNIMMGSEDFSLFSRYAPIFMYHLGTGNGSGYGLHNPNFVVQDGAVTAGAELLTTTAVEFLKG